MRSPREALRQLDLQLMLAEPTTTSIGPFLRDNIALMTTSLGMTEHEVVALSTMGDEPLVFFLGPALRLHWARSKDMAVARKTEQLRSASQLLTERVRWRGDRAQLDVSALFGPLLGSTAKILLFTSPAWQVGIARHKLRELARGLGHRNDLTAFVDDRGLHVHWRQGKGRLLLYPQRRPHLEQDVLIVPLVRADIATAMATAAE